MSAIDDKYNQLKHSGVDLGPPLGPEQDEAAGGRVRKYQNGNIYWDSATGAHEVHGGILSAYLANGGPGEHAGARLFGYPKTDEIFDGAVPHNLFEWGAIYWTPGTRGCSIWGPIYTVWQQQPNLGLPLTGNTPLAGGEVVYFERGVIFSANGQAPGVTQPLVGTLNPPLMGNPLILDPTNEEARRFRLLARWQKVERQQYNALTAWHPSIFSDIWNERLVASPVGSPFSFIPLICNQVYFTDQNQSSVDVAAIFEIFPNGQLDLRDRTLYDLQLNLPVGIPYNLSPHCIYAKKDWNNFGLFHITDLHVNRRNEEMRARLQQLGLTTAAQSYCNFQDNIRDFIRYANHLHDVGLADAVMATGDLIDYVAEEGEPFEQGNFPRLRRLLLGQPLDPGGQPHEGLRIPIFTTFGNHDYRLYPYNLIFDVDVPTMFKRLNEYDSHNIIESDAVALEGGKVPSYGLTNAADALRMLLYDEGEKQNAYGYFHKYFTDVRSFVVKLGKHRVVLLDTKCDDGVPLGGTPELIFDYLGDKLGARTLDPATKKLMKGDAPDSIGFLQDDLDLLRDAVQDAGSDGLVIVGMHTPAFSPKGGEYPYYLRETLLPSADPALVQEYIQRNDFEGASWMRSGAAFFKKGGNVSDGLNEGIAARGGAEFLNICVGLGASRPVDLVLCGHHHDRVEYRLRLDGQNIEYYMDFYTESPGPHYYHTKNGHDIGRIPKGAPIQVVIEPSAPPSAPIEEATEHRLPGLPVTFGRVTTPPYANPLNSSTDPKQWWIDHRPVLAETSALGPGDPRQRFGTFWKVTYEGPQPFDLHVQLDGESDTVPKSSRGLKVDILPARLPDTLFNGFRLVRVNGGVIARIRYVTMQELRSNNFRMQWEDTDAGDRRHPPIETTDPGGGRHHPVIGVLR